MRKQHPLITDLFNTLISCGYEGTIIGEVSHSDSLIEVKLILPYHKELSDFEDILPNITQEFNCYDSKIAKKLGKNITVLFSKKDLNNIPFDTKYLHPGTLKIELPSSYGSCYLDFTHDDCCHLLTGGATGMGKSKFLLYLSTILYVQTNGNIQLYINCTKAKDYFMFNGLFNVEINKTQEEFDYTLDLLTEEYKHRNSLLYLPELELATDAKDVLEKYPHMYYHFKPIFVLIDEYARFADHKEIQRKVTELVETARYVNIHIIIATQRPDARTVLPPRIKANLLTRLCFTTTDEANSIIILDKKGAENLGGIAGRAILSDKEMNTIQVPLIKTDEVLNQLKPFRRNNNEYTCNQNQKRPFNHELSSKIQGMFKESTSEIMFSEQQQSNKRMQSDNEKIVNGWFRLANPTFKE